MTTMPQVGEPAPDIQVQDAAGREVMLSNFWRDRAALLAFLRHYG